MTPAAVFARLAGLRPWLYAGAGVALVALGHWIGAAQSSAIYRATLATERAATQSAMADAAQAKARLASYVEQRTDDEAELKARIATVEDAYKTAVGLPPPETRTVYVTRYRQALQAPAECPPVAFGAIPVPRGVACRLLFAASGGREPPGCTTAVDTHAALP